MSKGVANSIRRVRPVDAASLLIVRGRGSQREVLMGRRRPASSFMPGWYVFPGGRVDPADSAVANHIRLHPDVAVRLERRARPTRAVALAVAAIRETYEETGLMVAQPAQPGSRRRANELKTVDVWRAFAAAGYVPTCDRLDYIARAITPATSPKRFDARFFLVAAEHVHGRLGGNGELLDLRWVPMSAMGGLPIADVTAFVLEEARRAIEGSGAPDRRVPLLCYVNGTTRIIRG